MSDTLKPSGLFASADSRTKIDDWLTRRLIEAGRRVKDGAVKPRFEALRFRAGLAAFDFAAPRDLAACLDWSISELEAGIVHMTHPRYFGLFNPAPAFAAECADRIVAAFNPQLAASATSPAAVEIEAHVLRAVADRAGYGPNSAGHFTSGGSEANFTALICALTHHEPSFAAEGARGFSGPPVFYVSADCHLAWIKIAHEAGLGRNAARLVTTDGAGRMNPQALVAMIAQDRAASRVPVMVVATAGTTNAGMIDPLVAIANIAQNGGLWFHADAAWGGALIASDRLRGALAGIERADSITIDAHKWFATTMGCGMFLTRHAGVLPQAFQVNTTFMPSAEPSRDPYMTSMQWSRRFLGLRLFLSLAAVGWQGYAAHVERAVALAGLLKDQLRAQGWSIANTSELAVVCFEPPDRALNAATLAKRVVDSGGAWISTATYEGRTVLRACVTHGETPEHDIATLCELLGQAIRAP